MTALDGTTAVVTGASGGMGRVIVAELARAGALVVAVARRPERIDAVRAEAARAGAPGTIEVVTGDLASLAGLHRVAEAVSARHAEVHVLVNNAGAHYADRRVTVDGLEAHVAVDHLAAFGMTRLLDAPLRRARARVVDVVSDSVRDARQVRFPGPARPPRVTAQDVADLRRVNPADGFVPFEAYARAKLLTVLAGRAAARRLGTDGVTVNAVHPGLVATELVDGMVPAGLRPFRWLVRAALLTPAEGAAAALRLATDPLLDGATGQYHVRDRETPLPAVADDVDLQEAVYRAGDTFLRDG